MREQQYLLKKIERQRTARKAGHRWNTSVFLHAYFRFSQECVDDGEVNRKADKIIGGGNKRPRSDGRIEAKGI